MADDFLARLKAAHEKATPGPWGGAWRGSMPPGMDRSQARVDSDLATLLVNAAPELAALVEGMTPEKLRAIARALDLLDALLEKASVPDNPEAEARMRAAAGRSEMQEDLRRWAAALAALDKVQP